VLLPVPVGAWALGSRLWQWYQGPTAQVTAPSPRPPEPLPVTLSQGMVWVRGGEFVMGSTQLPASDCRPPHTVELAGFWADQHCVTNAQFQRFVAETQYVTTAEQVGQSQVFDTTTRRWQQVAGATWQHPLGPRSHLIEAENLPVVHVSWHDAMAYATWAGKRLLTEAEYEHAARGGLLDTRYAWGNGAPAADRPLANFWQGRFPQVDRRLDGFDYVSPVAQFPPNRFGLYDMAGNTWCWCSDWYDAQYYLTTPGVNPSGPSQGTERVLRGGSWLSTLDHPDQLAVATRFHAPPEFTSNDVSFRCARTSPSPARIARPRTQAPSR
jgi:formylglycine-generating enzyme